jgi:group I intron endonuclease
MACIYKISNLVNGKFYIGSTIRPTYIRKYEHLSALRNNVHFNNYLQKSFNKYGEENFKFEVVETFKFPKDYPKVNILEYIVGRELYLVDFLGAEYNLRKDITTGRVGYTHSEETRRKISEAHLKKREYRTLAESTLKNIDREKRRAEGKLIKRVKQEKIKKPVGGQKGYKHTPEAIEKIRQRSSQEDNKIRMRELQKIVAKNRIGQSCSIETKLKAMNAKFGVSRKILVYNMEGDLVYTCNFSTEASKFTGVKRSAISNVLAGISYYAGEYLFEYKNIEE